MRALSLYAGLLLTSLSGWSQSIWADDSESIRMFKGFLSCDFRWVADIDPTLDSEEKEGTTYLLLKAANGKILSVETGQSTPAALDKFLRRATEAFNKMHLFIPVDPCDSTVMIPIKYGLFTGNLQESPKKIIDDNADKDLAQEHSEPLILVSTFKHSFGLKVDHPIEVIREIFAPYMFHQVLTRRYPEKQYLCITYKSKWRYH